MTSVLWHWRISLICRFLLHRVIAVYRSSSESSRDVLRWYMLSQLLQMTNTHRRLVLIYICMILPTQHSPPPSWVGGQRDIWGPLGGSTDTSGRGTRLLYISVNKILLHHGFCTSKCLLYFFSSLPSINFLNSDGNVWLPSVTDFMDLRNKNSAKCWATHLITVEIWDLEPKLPK